MKITKSKLLDFVLVILAGTFLAGCTTSVATTTIATQSVDTSYAVFAVPQGWFDVTEKIASSDPNTVSYWSDGRDGELDRNSIGLFRTESVTGILNIDEDYCSDYLELAIGDKQYFQPESGFNISSQEYLASTRTCQVRYNFIYENGATANVFHLAIPSRGRLLVFEAASAADLNPLIDLLLQNTELK